MMSGFPSDHIANYAGNNLFRRGLYEYPWRGPAELFEDFQTGFLIIVREQAHMSCIRRLLILALFALGFCLPPSPLFAQTAKPIQAELIQRLNARKVKVGDPILAKLASPWKSPECDLRSGAIIQGHVVTRKAHSKTEKISEIGITFESGQCGGPEMKPLFLTIAAVLAPSYSDPEEMQPLNSAIGLGLNGGMRSLNQAAATVYVEPRRPRSVRAGQVVGIPTTAGPGACLDIGNNRVLAHVGQELRVYGPGLQLSERIPLGGPLAFLQISPASEFFAVGVIHERHTREIHRQLEQAELREPEEDVEIRLLDSHFRSLTTIMRSSRFPAPILLNEGEVHIPSLGRNRWQIVENSWSGQRRVLAVASSTCRPQADSMPGNLLFVLGCEGQKRWYRILRGDGKVLLKGRSSSREVGQTAGGNIGRNAFAIRIARSAESRSLQSAFKPSELKSSHVAVYRAKNGRRIFSIGMPDLVPAVQAFAISPSEDQMAFLKSTEIAVYQVQLGE
jgi:hypothetical protein